MADYREDYQYGSLESKTIKSFINSQDHAYHSRDLKKNFDEIDNKLRHLQSELSTIGKKAGQPMHQPPQINERVYQAHPLSTYHENQQPDIKSYPNPFDTSVTNPRPPTGHTNQARIDRASQEEVPRRREQARDVSPKPRQEETRQDETIIDIKGRLRKVFQFYTSFGDRCNASQLKSNKFHKMMLDAGIRDYLTQKQLDLLFVAENKHKANMTFEVFLNLLTKVAKQMYRNENISDPRALDLLLKHHLFPLYDSLYNETEMGLDEKKFHEEIDENIILILRSVVPLLSKMYQVYFPWEIQTSQQINIVKQRTENALFIFLKDFDICPALITKSTSYLIWTEVLDTPIHKLTRSNRIPSIIPFLEKDFGTLFTFARFLAFLARAAIIAYDNQTGPNMRRFTNSERLALMLERMELSPGMLNFEKKTSIPHNSKTSLIVPKEVLERIISGNEPPEDVVSTRRIAQSEQTQDQSMNKRSKSEVRLHSMLRDTSNTRSQRDLSQKAKSSNNSKFNPEESQMKVLNMSKYQFDDPNTESVLDKYRDNLHRIFQYYCTFGEPMNNSKLKSIKFMKMLKECGLLQPGLLKNTGDTSFRILENVRVYESTDKRTLTQIDADMIFVSLTGSKQLKDHNEKNVGYDKNIKSPTLGYYNHLHKNIPLVNVMSKLDYEGFLKSIEMMAEKLLPEWEPSKAIRHIIEKYFLKIDQQISQVALDNNKAVSGQPLQLLVDILKDPEMVQFLGMVHKAMLVYFNHYADSKGLMNFEKFVKFCKDFSLFPDIIPKGKVTNFFYTLAAIHTQAEQIEPCKFILISNNLLDEGTSLKKNTSMSRFGNQGGGKAIEQPEDELIDQHLFVEALALCAFEIPYGEPQPSPIEKVKQSQIFLIIQICYLLERMNQSDGISVVQKEQGLTRSPTGARWDILHNIRKKYPHLFGLIPPEEPPKNAFDHLVKENYGGKY